LLLNAPGARRPSPRGWPSTFILLYLILF
jgi:hypothetical protein